jgi:hypothetical protein
VIDIPAVSDPLAKILRFSVKAECTIPMPVYKTPDTFMTGALPGEFEVVDFTIGTDGLVDSNSITLTDQSLGHAQYERRHR